MLQDPTGIGAELQREAREWTWEKIEREADAWVADKLVVWSEYCRSSPAQWKRIAEWMRRPSVASSP